MTKSWWKEGVVYQIYPRSFNDTNGDGIGDLRGIIEKLDYLNELGVDILWLSPIYQSPNDDNGYDISDYRNIMTEFGTMEDFDELLDGIHARGMKLLMDLVVNHTSDEHAWFEQSRSSKDNPYRDYYYWKPEKPNNWKSLFGGDAWEYDDRTGEYYLHLFTKKQPDLNWENSVVRQEVYDLMRFWLDKGVDGFRMDVIPFISKRLDFPDADFSDFNKVIAEVYANGPRLHEFLHEMNQEVMAHYDMMTVGEGVGIAPEQALLYVGEDRQELNMFFHFDHMFIDHGPGGKFDVVDVDFVAFKQVFSHWHHAVGDRGWINVYLDNHDFPRMVSRFGNDQTYRIRSAKVLATLLLTMRGTPCIYQGSEIGMTNVQFESLDDYRDVETLNTIQEWKDAGKNLDELLPLVHTQGRDNVRTPIQWSDERHAGFTSGEPWIKVNPNYPEINAQRVLNDPASIYYYYQALLKLRKDHPTWVYGEFEDLAPSDERLFLYKRWDENGTYYIALNFSEESILLSELETWGKVELLFNNLGAHDEKQLEPWEARIYQVK